MSSSPSAVIRVVRHPGKAALMAQIRDPVSAPTFNHVCFKETESLRRLKCRVNANLNILGDPAV